jgi:hypothetical protein
VADEHHGRRQGVDRGNHRVDVVAQADVRAVGVAGLEAGKGERVHGVSGIRQRCGHLVP